MKLEYPMNDSLPNVEHARDRFLSRLFAYRKQPERHANDEDYELLYAYGVLSSTFLQFFLLTYCRSCYRSNRRRNHGYRSLY
jgi:hypothetical protein